MKMEHFYQGIEGWFNYQDIFRGAVLEYPSGSAFLEIGSWLGKSTAFMGVEIINSGKDIEFYCVDTWLGSKEHQNNPLVFMNILHEEFLKNVNSVRGVIHPIRNDSISASADFQDGSLSLVFVDGSHDYESVKADLAAWFPKVASGGTFAGHDYGVGWPGVRTAVNEFAKEQHLTITTSKSSWIIRVP
jgi:hypothetical protein